MLADANQIQLILRNLCGNALQALRDPHRPGTIEVRLEQRIVDETPNPEKESQPCGKDLVLRPGSYAYLSVRDNGCGMDAATRARLFEPCYTTKPVGEGTGLGLSVVHGIVQHHDATLGLRSSVGEGTTFCIWFPAAQASDCTAPAQASGTGRLGYAAAENELPALHLQGTHVLYVDDDESIIFLMTRLLQRKGYRASAYTDPRAAVAAVRADPGKFDLVITDYNMPKLSGLEVAQALQEIRANLPLAIASGYITDELREQAPAAGVRELIYKPNTVDELCEAVARMAGSLRGRSPG